MLYPTELLGLIQKIMGCMQLEPSTAQEADALILLSCGDVSPKSGGFLSVFRVFGELTG